LKVGFKKLFFWDELNKIHELNPLCVLDFFVNEEFQRNGFGKVINLKINLLTENYNLYKNLFMIFCYLIKINLI